MQGKTGYSEVGGGSCLGKQMATLKQKKEGSCIELYEGGIKIVNYRLACCNLSECLGWTKGYEVIPKQCIVSVVVEARKQCCCVPLCCICHILTSVVVFELLTKGNTKNNQKCLIFEWNLDELKQAAEQLHNYVYGSVAGQGIVNDAHNLAHFINQGLVVPSPAKIELSKN